MTKKLYDFTKFAKDARIFIGPDPDSGWEDQPYHQFNGYKVFRGIKGSHNEGHIRVLSPKGWTAHLPAGHDPEEYVRERIKKYGG